ncbi:MAG: hypothetical protein HZA77_08610 [Candidatus Schekmanbacteria bacterium]|nr:hypothetical protein [Candidatus Schekmanbacteria bacterium]
MRCPKCSGIMVLQRFFDRYYSFEGWRCVNCGTIIDGIILENRKKANSQAA